MPLATSDYNRLVASSRDSLFPEFWDALLSAVRITGLSPARLLTDQKRLIVPELHRDAVERLREAECPFGLVTSRYGWASLLGALRVIAGRVGVGGEMIDFDCI